MYGKRRVILRRDGKIVLAGNKTWHPIGLWFKNDLTVKVKVLRPECRYDQRLDATNAELIICASKDEARERIADLYA